MVKAGVFSVGPGGALSRVLGAVADKTYPADAYLVAGQDIQASREVNGLRCRCGGGRGRGRRRGACARCRLRVPGTRDQISPLVLVPDPHLLASPPLNLALTRTNERYKILRDQPAA